MQIGVEELVGVDLGPVDVFVRREVENEVRTRAADLGVSIEEVATTVSSLVGGVRVGKYSSGGRRVDVRLKLLAGQRSRPDDLGRLRTTAGDPYRVFSPFHRAWSQAPRREVLPAPAALPKTAAESQQ